MVGALEIIEEDDAMVKPFSDADNSLYFVVEGRSFLWNINSAVG